MLTRKLVSDYITLPVPEFCTITGLGQTLVRAMISDGRLQGYRAGKKKLMVVVQSYLDHVEAQNAQGMPEYEGAMKAVAARKAKQAEREAAKSGVDLGDLGLL
jgi:uncharacterized protein (DUF2336 family)